MRIINGIKLYKKQENEAVKIDGNGWDTYNGQNYQWYTLYYIPSCGIVKLVADSTSWYGNYETKYFSSPKTFLSWCNNTKRSLEELLGEIDEDNAAAMSFIQELKNNKTKRFCEIELENKAEAEGEDLENMTEKEKDFLYYSHYFYESIDDYVSRHSSKDLITALTEFIDLHNRMCIVDTTDGYVERGIE